MDDKVGSISTWVAKFDETEMAAFSSRQTIKIFTREHRGIFRSLCVKGIVSTLSFRERGGAWYLVGSAPLTGGIILKRLVGPLLFFIISPFPSWLECLRIGPSTGSLQWLLFYYTGACVPYLTELTGNMTLCDCKTKLVPEVMMSCGRIVCNLS